MAIVIENQSRRRTARIAGLLYLAMASFTIFGLIYVHNSVYVPGDATLTTANLITSETLYRVGIVCALIGAVLFVFLGSALYLLFQDVDKNLALLMVIFVVITSVLFFANVGFELIALGVLQEDSMQSVFTGGQLEALSFLSFNLYQKGLMASSVFWGLWLFPFAMLILKSGFIPRLFGILLIFAGAAYVIAWLGVLVLPSQAALINNIAIIPEGIGELSIMLWLLIKGVSTGKTPA